MLTGPKFITVRICCYPNTLSDLFNFFLSQDLSTLLGTEECIFFIVLCVYKASPHFLRTVSVSQNIFRETRFQAKPSGVHGLHVSCEKANFSEAAVVLLFMAVKGRRPKSFQLLRRNSIQSRVLCPFTTSVLPWDFLASKPASISAETLYQLTPHQFLFVWF